MRVLLPLKSEQMQILFKNDDFCCLYPKSIAVISIFVQEYCVEMQKNRQILIRRPIDSGDTLVKFFLHDNLHLDAVSAIRNEFAW